MTRQEWDVLAALIEEWWPSSSFPESRQAAWFIELEGHDASAVERALRGLLREGKDFPPNLGQLVARLEQPTAAPSWTTAWSLICRAISRGFRESYDPVVAMDAGQRWLAQHDVVVAAFAQDYGLRRLWEEPTGDPDRGPKVLAAIGKAYDRFCEQFARDERRAGLDVAMRRRSLTSGPRRLSDPLAVAGLSKPELSAGGAE